MQHICTRERGDLVLCACCFYLWPKVDIYIRADQKECCFCRKWLNFKKKRREPKMQFNTQFQAHYLSLSINLAMVQKVAHNSLKCWLNTSSAQHYFLSQYDGIAIHGRLQREKQSLNFYLDVHFFVEQFGFYTSCLFHGFESVAFAHKKSLRGFKKQHAQNIYWSLKGGVSKM